MEPNEHCLHADGEHLSIQEVELADTLLDLAERFQGVLSLLIEGIRSGRIQTRGFIAPVGFRGLDCLCNGLCLYCLLLLSLPVGPSLRSLLWRGLRCSLLSRVWCRFSLRGLCPSLELLGLPVGPCLGISFLFQLHPPLGLLFPCLSPGRAANMRQAFRVGAGHSDGRLGIHFLLHRRGQVPLPAIDPGHGTVIGEREGQSCPVRQALCSLLCGFHFLRGSRFDLHMLASLLFFLRPCDPCHLLDEGLAGPAQIKELHTV
mmetsp:Transcript_71878/g.166327  ORF Transcript_71878/g.166327 Transcript_71878/m.166327 type:complete len:260 (+) Transcript_71878:1347-2126(+)